jgi:hypothetical protein
VWSEQQLIHINSIFAVLHCVDVIVVAGVYERLTDSILNVALCASSLSTGAAYTRVLSVLTGKNPEDSSQVNVEATQWVLLYLSIGHDGCYKNISRITARICRSTIMQSFGYNSQIKY